MRARKPSLAGRRGRQGGAVRWETAVLTMEGRFGAGRTVAGVQHAWTESARMLMGTCLSTRLSAERESTALEGKRHR